VIAVWIGMPRSMTFEMIGRASDDAGRTRRAEGHDAVPADQGRVGLMLDSMRLPGWIEFADPGLTSNRPVVAMMTRAGTTTPDAKNMLIVL